MNVLKVLQLIPTLDRSGAEKQMVMLAKGLPRDRFRVEVATLTRLGPLEAELSAAGIPVTVIGKRFKLDPIALARLVRFLKAGTFDVVQTWIFAANTYGRVAARLAGVPVVVVAEMAVDLWKGRSERFVDRRLATWCDRLVGNSHAVVDFYRGLGVPDDRLAMIYSGSRGRGAAGGRSGVRSAPSSGSRPRLPLVLFAGRLAEQKRVDDLLKALDLLQHVQPDLRTLIVGDGPLRERLEETAQAYHLDGRVRFLGHRDDVPRLLAAADVVVLPSCVRGPAQRGARGDAVSQAGRRHRRAGDDRGRRRRRDRAARPGRQRHAPGPGDPRPRARPCAGQPPGRGRPSPRRGPLPRRHDGRAVRRAVRKPGTIEGVKMANGGALPSATVPWVAAVSKHGYEIALEWIESKQEMASGLCPCYVGSPTCAGRQTFSWQSHGTGGHPRGKRP